MIEWDIQDSMALRAKSMLCLRSVVRKEAHHNLCLLVILGYTWQEAGWCVLRIGCCFSLFLVILG